MEHQQHDSPSEEMIMVHQPSPDPDRHPHHHQPDHHQPDGHQPTDPELHSTPHSDRSPFNGGDPIGRKYKRPKAKRPKATIAAWVAVAIALVEVVVRVIER
jgi:hypothetical protein